jgi:adenine-specific DNA-methyltransferase
MVIEKPVEITLEDLDDSKEIELQTHKKTFVPKEQHIFQSTRYQGSKHKLSDWIWRSIKDIKFDTCLDAFGGTGAVSHKLKKNGKTITYNDLLKCNFLIGRSNIENSEEVLSDDDIEYVLTKHHKINYPTFVVSHFENIYFPSNENAEIDVMITNISNMKNEYKSAMAFNCLAQSCLIKRPYNLFHRANLYMRTADVERSFGNKTSWDKSFNHWFRFFAKELNESIFDNGKTNNSINYNVFDIPNSHYDLVYIDTPYVSSKGSSVNYLDFYHFLEGLARYNEWNYLINEKNKTKSFKKDIYPDVWNKKNIFLSIDKLCNKFQDAVLVISYRSDGIPTIEELICIIKKYKKHVRVVRSDYRYVLSKTQLKEVLIIGE